MVAQTEMPFTYSMVCTVDDVYNCIAYQKLNLLDVATKDFFRVHVDKSHAFGGVVKPEEIIMKFYLYGMALRELEKKYGRHTVINDTKIIALLTEIKFFMVKEVFRSIHYLLGICLREVRHTTDSENVLKTSLKEAFLNIEGKNQGPLYGAAASIANVLRGRGFFGCSSSEATNIVLRNFPEGYTIEETLYMCKAVFSHGSFSSGSYGGSAWEDITDVAINIFSGRMSLYVGLDTAFSLSHNCGSIYNKGFLYYASSPEEIFNFVLDIQRSGQLMNAVNSQYLFTLLNYSSHDPIDIKPLGLTQEEDFTKLMQSDYGLYPLVRLLNDLNPEEYLRPLSFLKIKECGGVGDYTTQIKKEIEKGVETPLAKEYIKAYLGELPKDYQGVLWGMDPAILQKGGMAEPKKKYTGLQLKAFGEATGLSHICPESKPINILFRTT